LEVILLVDVNIIATAEGNAHGIVYPRHINHLERFGACRYWPLCDETYPLAKHFFTSNASMLGRNRKSVLSKKIRLFGNCSPNFLSSCERRKQVALQRLADVKLSLVSYLYWEPCRRLLLRPNLSYYLFPLNQIIVNYYINF
jgi:hypothetical protein